MHRTSLNVSISIHDKIKETSEKYCISRRKLILMIFTYCHDNLDFDKFIFGLTKYQKIAPGEKWKCLRVDFDDTQCDIYFFYRNRFRISLSKLLAVGFVLFFDRILEKLNQSIKLKKEDFSVLLNSYTEIKALLTNFVKDAFKFFKKPIADTA
ncbi:MAG: hypothetical protein JW982_06435 [Spirochaetes bacterium]|nr:hypothetical protein [Spirochaetota bacterium]